MLNDEPEQAFTRSIQGQLLRLSERREVAIFLRDGVLWVADFIDSQGELIDAITWFRFNCGSLSTWHARHRMLVESATPLSAELVDRIERLQRPAPVRTRIADALVVAIAACRSRMRQAATAVCRIGRHHKSPRTTSQARRSSWLQM